MVDEQIRDDEQTEQTPAPDAQPQGDGDGTAHDTPSTAADNADAPESESKTE